MNLENNLEIKSVIKDKFGTDISSIIYKYMNGICNVCKKVKFNSYPLVTCNGCDKLVCNYICTNISLGYNPKDKETYFDDFCIRCYLNCLYQSG